MSKTSAAHEDEHLFAQAMAEIESGQPQSGLWAKAFADADGDERKAKARYLTLRVKALSAEQATQAETPAACADSSGADDGNPPRTQREVSAGAESERLVASEFAEVTSQSTPMSANEAGKDGGANRPTTDSALTPALAPLGWLPLTRHTIVCLALFGLLTPSAPPAMKFGSAFWWADAAGRALVPAIFASLVFLFCSLFFTRAVKNDGKRLWVRTLWICALIGFACLWYVDLSRDENSETAWLVLGLVIVACIACVVVSLIFAVFWIARLAISSRAPRDPNRFRPVENGSEVLDTKTGLIWRRCAEGMEWDGDTCTGSHAEYAHHEALQHAESEAQRTGKKWRLPSKEELAEIVDKRQRPAIDSVAFPATPAIVFWSSSPYEGSTSYAWLVDFSFGLAVNSVRSSNYAVRLVRSSQ